MVTPEQGFITLATGDILYYKAAYQLLQSYRYQKGHCRFCIVCDRKNKYTQVFDDVIVLENCHFDYRDKFELLRIAPYEKNIFIEPDCLIYKNIDDFWNMFQNATPLSAFGYNDGDLDFWFKNKQLIETTFNVKSIPIFNPGYLYIEKNKVSSRCYNDLIEISKQIALDNRFSSEEKLFNGLFLRDDPIFCLAMERNNCNCAVKQSTGKCLSLPSVIDFVELKMTMGQLSAIYNLNGSTTQIDNCYILHFSSRRLKEWLYFQQILVVHCLNTPLLFWLATIFESKAFGWIIKKLFKIKSEIKRLLNNKSI